jgi:rhomboid protease GluP
LRKAIESELSNEVKRFLKHKGTKTRRGFAFGKKISINQAEKSEKKFILLQINYMPKKEETISLGNLDTETALAISYQAFTDLGWPVLFAGEDKLQAQTIKKWNSYPQQVLVEAAGNELIITSEMINNELADITGKNKTNISNFINAFEAAKNNMQAHATETNKGKINELRSLTEIAVRQEIKDAEEIDKAMNLSGSNLYVTYCIMAINVLVFILMAVNGAGIFEPNGFVHIKWGSNYSPLTLTGDWWRLVTNVFIHFGIIHIAMNMYCLYMVGVYLEPMLGKTKYIAAYLCTGVLASLVSLWWHKEGVNSAGASGAIFGLYGLFLALLTTKLIPQKVRDAQLKSIGIFVVYNLVYGMKGGVDNAAHIGGLISGFVIGYLYAIIIKKERQEQKAAWVMPLIVIATIGIAAGYLSNNKKTDAERNAVLSEVKSADYKDGEKFNEALNAISAIEDKAVEPLSDTSLTDPELKIKIQTICMPSWAQVEEKLKQMQKYEVSPAMQQKTTKLLEYVELRKKELDVFNRMIDTGDQQKLIPELNELRNGMNVLAAEISKL